MFLVLEQQKYGFSFCPLFFFFVNSYI